MSQATTSISGKDAVPTRAEAEGVPPPAGATIAWFLALLGWTTLLCFYDLDGGARFEPIDCWVAQTAREMREADDWIVPRFAGEVRMQKSPGPYWAVMLTSLVRGTPVDELTARIPNAVAAIVLVATVFWLARRIAGDRAAVFAGFAASASPLIFWWSHRAASDLGLTTCTTLALAALWIACETQPPGRRRIALLLLGYFAAGVGMLYKMPMPLVAVGLPAAAYVVLRWRWRILWSGWHLVGLLVFLLPWLPWAVAVLQHESIALAKWKVEFWDRLTGDLPNVAEQDRWYYYFTYLGPPLLYCLPFTLSLPAALARALRRQPRVNRNGTLFLAVWFLSLLAFFTAATGKEWRYLLPALPPLYILLGIELAAFFDPRRRPRPGWDRAGVLAVGTLAPLALFAGGWFALRKWWQARGQYELEGLSSWGALWWAYLPTAAILTFGLTAAAWLYWRRREHASFGAIVATMWLMWLWAWPNVVPRLMSQRPFLDFARQLETHVPPERRAALRQVGTHDSRIIWCSDLRFPRVIDQLELLREQQGRRSLEYEFRRYGQEMVRLLADEQLHLFVAPLETFLMFRLEAPAELARTGQALPPLHLWLQTRYGDFGRHFVLFGNRPPPFPAPELRVPDKVRARLEAAPWPAEGRPATSGPETAPASGS